MGTSPQTQEEVGNLLLSHLPPEEFELLRPHLERVRLSQGQSLIEPGEPIRHIYFPAGCLGSLVAVMEDGSTAESGAVGREGMVGVPVLLADGITTMQTVVQVAGDAFVARGSVVKEIFDRGGPFQKLLYRYIHTIFIVASQTAA